MERKRKSKGVKKCATKGCKHTVKRALFCDICRQRVYRQNHEIKYIYSNLKHNAKRRGKEFTITLDEFVEFCKETGYVEGRGIKAENLTIDRIDPTKGYTKENIRAVTLSENVKLMKGTLEDWLIKEKHCPY